MKKMARSGGRGGRRSPECDAVCADVQSRLGDDRANQLLKIFCEIEEYEGRLSEAQFGELLYRAAHGLRICRRTGGMAGAHGIEL